MNCDNCGMPNMFGTCYECEGGEEDKNVINYEGPFYQLEIHCPRCGAVEYTEVDDEPGPPAAWPCHECLAEDERERIALVDFFTSMGEVLEPHKQPVMWSQWIGVAGWPV